MDIVDPKSEWSGEAYSKTQEMSLPPDWKKAYDGEGRSYYYHVVTRFVQNQVPNFLVHSCVTVQESIFFLNIAKVLINDTTFYFMVVWESIVKLPNFSFQ